MPINNIPPFNRDLHLLKSLLAYSVRLNPSLAVWQGGLLVRSDDAVHVGVRGETVIVLPATPVELIGMLVRGSAELPSTSGNNPPTIKMVYGEFSAFVKNWERYNFVWRAIQGAGTTPTQGMSAVGILVDPIPVLNFFGDPLMGFDDEENLWPIVIHHVDPETGNPNAIAYDLMDITTPETIRLTSSSKLYCANNCMVTSDQTYAKFIYVDDGGVKKIKRMSKKLPSVGSVLFMPSNEFNNYLGILGNI